MAELLHPSLKHKEKTEATLVLSVFDPHASEEVARLARAGGAIGGYNRGVCYILGDGANERFLSEVRSIKGEERSNRPLAAALSSERFIALIDHTKIPDDLHGLFSDPAALSQIAGSLFFIRAPLRKEALADIPPAMVSHLEDGTTVMQSWDPYGHHGLERVISKMHEAGINYPGITSMNESGKPEIVNQKEGIAFASKKHIPLFLNDPQDPGRVKGSYTIVGVGPEGLTLIRAGNMPSTLVSPLFGGREVDKAHAKQAKYKTPRVSHAIHHLDQKEIRRVFIDKITRPRIATRIFGSKQPQ